MFVINMNELEPFILLSGCISFLLLLLMVLLASFLVVRKDSKPDHSFVPSSGVKNRMDRCKLYEKQIGERLSPPLQDFILNKDCLKLFVRRWKCENTKPPRGVVILVHGVGEHCTRYDYFARCLNDQGYSVWSFDLQGHGQSEGDRTYVKRFEDYVEDVELVTNLARKEEEEEEEEENDKEKNLQNLPYFLIGHSMGGLIAIETVIMKQKLNFHAAIFSGPALEPNASMIEKSLAHVLVRFIPKSATPAIPAEKLSYDFEIVDGYVNDPLVFQKGPSFSCTVELVNHTHQAIRMAHKVHLPYLLLRGKDDTICLQGGCNIFHALTASKIKTHKELHGMKHEIFNEKGFQAIQEVIQFIISQTP